MSTTPSPLPSPLTKWKHALIVSALAAAGAAIGTFQTFISDPAGILLLTAVGGLIGEALTYEHSA
jgi:hypothetical protein